ncbi:PREDICTED: uncharacterized protein LOC109179151 [Ipomoea nil]|uniref:uncharacterized protein LOC109179151 n=1 Tax=Ipomoea nil TaxID=35883 RepID=UPI0009016AA5|nr:PREDICTED: uncharacterized protein LOC109179151 [Ipomoea nil]
MELMNQPQAQSFFQETPMGEAGTNTPNSSQWRTPAATPSRAWNPRVLTQPQEDEAVFDDDMEQDGVSYDYPVIRVTKEEKERFCRPWRRSLILHLLGRTVSYSYLLQRLQRMWNPESSFQLIALDQDYFLAKFNALSDYETAKFGGPWMVLDHYLIAQEWRPNFNPRKNKTDSILAWVRFPSLPIEYFDDDFLKKIGKTIGRPIKIDYVTNLVSKGKFARVCIELDITKPVLSRFVLNFEEWPIEYEGIHQICFKCGIYCHRIKMCGKDQTETTTIETTTGSTEPQLGMERPVQKPKEKYGAWMLVTRKDRRKQ